MVTEDWFPKINTIVHSQAQKCDAETSGTDVADCEATIVDQEVRLYIICYTKVLMNINYKQF